MDMMPLLSIASIPIRSIDCQQAEVREAKNGLRSFTPAYTLTSTQDFQTPFRFRPRRGFPEH